MNSSEASLPGAVSTAAPRSLGTSALKTFWIGPGFVVGMVVHSLVFFGASTTLASTFGAPFNAAAVFATIALTSAALSILYDTARRRFFGPLNLSILSCVASGTIVWFISGVTLDVLSHSEMWRLFEAEGFARLVTLMGIMLTVSAMSVEASGRIERILN